MRIAWGQAAHAADSGQVQDNPAKKELSGLVTNDLIRGVPRNSSGDRDARRGAGGYEAREDCERSGKARFGGAIFGELAGGHCHWCNGMRGLRRGYAAAAIMTTGTDAAYVTLRFRAAVTVMSGAKAASVRRRSCRGERERKECSDKRQQQEKSCGRALHSVL